jgi:hypothetical protein
LLLGLPIVVEVLGRVKGLLEAQRGADVSLRVAVPWQWLSEGRTIEVELPRNLVCASCAGGGCSVCGNSGAISVRGRGELPEIIQVYLPEQRRVEPSHPNAEGPLIGASAAEGNGEAKNAEPPPSVRPVTIRIPECGGLPEPGSGAKVRGCLLLYVTIAAVPSTNLRLADDEAPLSSSKMLRAEVRPEPEDGSDEAEPQSSLTERRASQPSAHSARPLSASSARVAKIPSVRATTTADEVIVALPAISQGSKQVRGAEPNASELASRTTKQIESRSPSPWILLVLGVCAALLGIVWLW